jgi:hypothetical protein
LQSSLKEAQYPALPSSDDELEDFAAGMAMGFDILSVLEQRDEQVCMLIRNSFWPELAKRSAVNAGYLRRI